MLQATTHWDSFSAVLHLYRVDSKHGVGLVCLVEEGVEIRKAKAEFTRGSAFRLESVGFYPAPDCRSGNTQVLAGGGGVHPGFGFRSGHGGLFDGFHGVLSAFIRVQSLSQTCA